MKYSKQRDAAYAVWEDLMKEIKDQMLKGNTTRATSLLTAAEKAHKMYDAICEQERKSMTAKECTLPHYVCTRQHYPYTTWTGTTWNTGSSDITYGSTMSGEKITGPEEGQDPLPGLEETG